MNKAIYEKLKEVAKAQGITAYSDIAPLAGLDMANPDHRHKIAEILGEISRAEHTLGQPMLSAVVIQRDSVMPGQGFFTLARELSLYAGGNDQVFFNEELKKVHAFWR